MAKPPSPTTPVVRPKASQRKGRTGTIGHRARRPAQKRSADRFDAILAATEELLQTANIEDISFYDIARQADLPPASVHYLFPTMSAVRIEMCRIYNQQAFELIVAEQDKMTQSGMGSWQDRIRYLAEILRGHFNSRRPVCEVLLGPVLNREARLATIDTNNQVGRASLDSLRRGFNVPDIPGLEQVFAYNAEILDALWSRSYLCNGWIDDECLEDTLRIQIANLRSLLPDMLVPREIGPAKEAAAEG